MDNDEKWDAFEKSGKISDYLIYKGLGSDASYDDNNKGSCNCGTQFRGYQ